MREQFQGEAERERQQRGLDTSEEAHGPAASRRALRLYVAVLLCWPFLLLVGTVVWMATPAYQRHAQYPSFVGIGYGSRLRGADCDVLVDGDSSALTGVMPSVIESRTGLKTCNIAEVAGVKMINGFLELDDYLAHNRPPHFLVFQFVPENLNDPAQWYEVATFEGWFYRLRFHRDAGLVHMILHDPQALMVAAELGLRTGAQWLPQHALPPALAQLREHNGGHLPEPGPVLTRCLPPPIQRAPNAEYLRQLRSHYASAQTTVLIDVTPEPACDPSYAFYRQRTGEGVTDLQLESLPLSEYTDTGRLHTDTTGAREISERIAAQLEDKMRAQGNR